ncbi:hypothetical protein FA95DRAFT_1506891, partial [Auriscalpium vulgare]
MILGAELIFREEQVHHASIRLDNVAAIQATQSAKAKPGSYLLDAAYTGIDVAARRHQGSSIAAIWVPGHAGIEGNEASDEEAKAAARGLSSNARDLPAILRERLPISKSAAKQAFRAKLKDRRVVAFEESTRYAHIQSIDESMPSSKYRKATARLPRRH